MAEADTKDVSERVPQNPVNQSDRRDLAWADAHSQMVGVTGFESEVEGSQDIEKHDTYATDDVHHPQIAPQNFSALDPDLALIVQKWKSLPAPLKNAVMAIVGAA